MKELTKKEIYDRMKEWRNMKKMYATALKRISLQKEEILLLREKMGLLEKQTALQGEIIAQQKLQIEELQKMVFKKKKKGKDDDDGPFGGSFGKHSRTEKTPRGKDSYQRVLPKEEEVTEHVQHAVSSCPDCQTAFTKKKVVTYYEEDIPLPTEELSLKDVTAHHVEQGWCPSCKKWKSTVSLPSTRVVLGKRVRLYICYLSLLLRCSFEQIRHLLSDTYHFSLSDGEIRNILVQTARTLQPEYEALKERIRTSGRTHLDETAWGDGWLWVAADARSKDVAYVAANSRGKGHATALLGETFMGVRITDGYGGYTYQAGAQQLCWAHLHRKVRDLARSKVMSQKVRNHCLRTYEKFSTIYAALRAVLEQPWKQAIFAQEAECLQSQIHAWTEPHCTDPKKLRDLKKHFKKHVEKYLTCLAFPDVPADNNRAERELRHFVIKRKISFGNKSLTGAHAFEILASVLMSLWRKTDSPFFPALSLLMKGV